MAGPNFQFPVEVAEAGPTLASWDSLPSDVLFHVLRRLSTDEGSGFAHSLVSRHWSSLALESQSSLHVRKGAHLSEGEILHLLGTFPGLTSLRLRPGSVLDMSDSALYMVTSSHRGRLTELHVEEGSLELDRFKPRGQHSRLTSSALRELLSCSPQLASLSLEGLTCEAIPGVVGTLQNLHTLRVCFAASRSGTPAPALVPEELGAARGLRVLSLGRFTGLTLPETLGKLSGLREFNLEAPQMAEVPSWLQRLQSLQELSLCCRADAIPDSLSVLSLSSLSLCMPRLTDLPGWLGGSSSLRRLQIESQVLAVLPDSLWRSSSLEVLSLACPSLCQLSADIGLLTSLRTISLHCPSLEVLPGSLSLLTSLDDVSVHGAGCCQAVADALPQLSRLRSLSLRCSGSGVKLRVPENLKDLQWLESLHVEGNADSLLSSGLELQKLRHLTLACSLGSSSSNPDAKSPHLLTIPPRVETLFLYSPPVDLNLCPLPQLKELHLRLFKGPSLPHSLSSLSCLESLDISLSGILSLPSTIGDLPRLKSLSLCALQSLSELPPSLGRLKSLRMLSLSFLSSLGSIPPGTLPVSLREVMLERLRWGHAGGCLPVDFSGLTELRRLELRSLDGIVRFPDTLACVHLPALRCLHVDSLRDLESLPDSLSLLTGLRELRLTALPELRKVPQGLSALPKLSPVSREELQKVESAIAKASQFAFLGEKFMLLLAGTKL